MSARQRIKMKWEGVSREQGEVGQSEKAIWRSFLLFFFSVMSSKFFSVFTIQKYISEGIYFLFFFEFYFIYFLYSRFLLVIHFIHINVYMSIPIPNLSYHHPPTTFPPWCPYVCSLHLCLNFCPANWFICTIFLGSTYMR